VKMEKLDFKKADQALYTGKQGRFDLIDVPPLPYLMIDGAGDPNTVPAYQRALEALYGLSYTLKFAAKAALGRDHVVGPLEGLWWADDLTDFAANNREGWKWCMMIRQPDWMTQDMLRAAQGKMAAKGGDAGLVRLETLHEGLCLQVLHIGPYTAEGPLLAQMHGQEFPARGLRAKGHHHEIYLSDPRKVAAQKLKTILRQPVERV
jgi:hypothetical protein